MIIEHQSYTLFNCISAHPHQKQQGIAIMQDIFDIAAYLSLLVTASLIVPFPQYT